MLAKYKIDPEKFEIIEIDNRKDMDEIQAYMKKVTGFFCQVHEKGDILQLHKISSIFNDIYKSSSIFNDIKRTNFS